MAKELNAATFSDAVAGNELTVVDFWATWCGPCRMLSPVLEEIEKESGLNLCKVNIDEQPELANRYGIEVIPTLLFFRNGKEIGRESGFRPKPMMLETIEKYSK